MITRTYTSLNLLLPTSFDPLSEETRRRLAAELAALFPAAVQCGSCGFGPVDRVACEDLASMHGLEYLGGTNREIYENDWTHLEGRMAPINNACPRCQWFSPSADDWPNWDGEIPAVRAPTFSSIISGDPAAVRDAARNAAVAVRLAAAASSDSCRERIFAIFFGNEYIPAKGLTHDDIVDRLRSEFDEDEVMADLDQLTDTTNDTQILTENEDANGEIYYAAIQQRLHGSILQDPHQTRLLRDHFGNLILSSDNAASTSTFG